ncbi:hypothetical protein GCM10023336_75680 [Streptomyces similanensis]|uniref:Uncharacterized protein n=1 Tax=Streptomyces similanensis TaxID=1274988 RepID=A0ABP9LRH1_9ACTN
MPLAITAAPAAGGRCASQAREGEVTGMIAILRSRVRRTGGARAGAPELRQGGPRRARAALATRRAVPHRSRQPPSPVRRPQAASWVRGPQAGRTTWWTAGAPPWRTGSSRTYAPGSGAWIIMPWPA